MSDLQCIEAADRSIPLPQIPFLKSRITIRGLIEKRHTHTLVEKLDGDESQELGKTQQICFFTTKVELMVITSLVTGIALCTIF